MKKSIKRELDVPLWSIAVLIVIFSVVAGTLAMGMVAARRDAREAREEVHQHRAHSEDTLQLLQNCLTPSRTTPPPRRHQCYEDRQASVGKALDVVKQEHDNASAEHDELLRKSLCFEAKIHGVRGPKGVDCSDV